MVTPTCISSARTAKSSPARSVTPPPKNPPLPNWRHKPSSRPHAPTPKLLSQMQRSVQPTKKPSRIRRNTILYMVTFLRKNMRKYRNHIGVPRANRSRRLFAMGRGGSAAIPLRNEVSQHIASHFRRGYVFAQEYAKLGD